MNKKLIFSLSFIIFLLVSFERVNASSVIGTTTTTPFYPNQRAICKDASGNLHVVWRYSSTAIYYARSSDGGNTWSVNTSFYGATSTATSTKYYPSISCDGNNITVVYDDNDAFDLIAAISTDSGQSWSWKVVVNGDGINSYPFPYFTPVVERRGQRIYIVYDWEFYDGTNYYDYCRFINSTDGGNTFGAVKNLASVSCRPSLAVDGTGGTSDKIYVAFYNGNDFDIYFINSTDSGVNWGTALDIMPGSFYYPSISFNSSNLYVTSDSSSYTVNFTNSTNSGINWTPQYRIDQVVSPNRAQYASVTVDNKGYPWVFWEENTTHANYDIVYRKFNGTAWESTKFLTNNNFGNHYVNTPSKYYGDGKIHYIWINGTASPYNLLYDFVDIGPPTYSLNSTNSTLAGVAVSHNLYWQDNVGLSYAIFSFDNCTGSLQNITGMSLSGASAWSNFTVTINSTVGCTIRWQVYANDTSNNWNATPIYSYVTTQNLYCGSGSSGTCPSSSSPCGSLPGGVCDYPSCDCVVDSSQTIQPNVQYNFKSLYIQPGVTVTVSQSASGGTGGGKGCGAGGVGANGSFVYGGAGGKGGNSTTSCVGGAGGINCGGGGGGAGGYSSALGGTGGSGGNGGGFIIINATSYINISGALITNGTAGANGRPGTAGLLGGNGGGGGGGGSGGGISLISSTVNISGFLNATGGAGGLGGAGGSSTFSDFTGGDGGDGGGGGRGGLVNISATYFYLTGTINVNGGAGGLGGAGGSGPAGDGANGAAGSPGSTGVLATLITTPKTPANGTSVFSTTVDLNFTVTSSVNTSFPVTVVLDNNIACSFPSYSNGTLQNCTVSGLSFTTHYWYVNASTTNGTTYTVYTKSDTWQFSLVQAIPTLNYNWTSPDSGTAYEPGKSYVFNVTACDLNGASDLASIIFEWNGQTNYTYPTVTNVTHNSTCLNFSITLNDLPAGNHNYKWYVNDSAGQATSLSSSYIIQGPPSLSYLWTSPDSGTAYEPGKSYVFNVSVCDPNYYTDNSTVIFEWNGANQTLSPLNSNECWYWNQTCFNCSITKTDLPANPTGYSYRWYANDSANLWGSSVAQSYIIQKATPTLNLLLDNVANDKEVTYPAQTNATAYETNQGDTDITYQLWRNTSTTATLIGSGPNIQDVLTLGAGTYYYRYNSSEGQNYTSNSTSIVLTITPKSISIYLALNGTQDNKTYVYPEAINATAWKDQTINDEGTVTLYRNGVSVGSPGQSVTEEILLGNGTYNYTAVFSAYNYTALPVTRFAFVNKGILQLAITGDQTVTYPTQTTVIGTENNIGDADVTYQLWRNDSLVNSSLNPGSLSETILLGAGSYVYRFNATGGANWTANSTGVTSTLTVQQNTSTVNFMNLTINGAENNVTVTYETYTNATGWYSTAVFGDQQITFTLLRNGQVIGSSNPVTDYLILGNGSYNYTYYTEGNQNYSSASKTYWVFVNKRTPVIKLYLNGTQGDRDYHYGEIVNSTITIDTIYPVTVALWNNLTGVYQQWSSGLSPLQNLTVLNYAPGKYNFTANFTGDENYTAAYDSHLLTLWHWANVTEINIANLFDGNKLNRSVTPITCRVLDANTSSAIANYPVKFWKNDTLLGTNYTNSTGYAVWYWNSTPEQVGPYTIKCNITDNATLYYNASVKEINTSIELWRKLFLDLTVTPSSIYRNNTFSPNSANFQAHLYDDNNTNVQSATDNIYFYVTQTGESYSCASGTTGVCSISYDPYDTITPGNYTIYSNHTQYSYSYPASDTKYLEIRGLLRPRIDTPSNGQIFHKNESISLTSTILDENSQSVSQATINWTLNGTQISSAEDSSWVIPLTQPSGSYYLNITANKTFYDTGQDSRIIEIWGYYVTLNEPSAYKIWHKTETVEINSSVRDERDNSLSAWSWANWTLNGTQIGSANVTTWNIPADYSRGLHQLNISIFTTYEVKNYTWVYIYGWSNLTEISPDSGSYAEGTIVPITCKVTDANSTQAIGNYPVSFYKSDSFVTTNYTNSSGYAVWYWNTTGEAAGSYTIKCNITDNDTLYYNVTSFNELSAVLSVSKGLTIDQILREYDTIYRNDTYASTWGKNWKSNITVHVIEAALGNSENANVSFYNSTHYLGSCITNSTGYCEFTFNPPDDTIPQNYTIYINATKETFNPSSTHETWIIVKSALYIPSIILPSPSILYKTQTYWLNSTVVSYDNYQPEVEGVSVNWTNSTGGLLTTGINATWTIPADYPLGPITFNATATKQYYDSYSKTGSKTVYGYSNVSLVSPIDGSYDRGATIKIVCQVTDANSSVPISNYPVKFWNDTTNVYSGFTNQTGYAEYDWSTAGLNVGPHNLNCTIADNDTLFYTASFSNAFTSVNLTGNLSASLISVSQQTVYRNNSLSPNSTNVTVRILDEYSSPVEGANVSFYQNESYLGYCQTNSTGYCTYTYNPSDNLQPGNYSIKFNATQTYYHASNTVETVITVKGKLYPVIVYPLNGKFYRNDSIQLNSTTKDENNNFVTPDLASWSLDSESLGNGENITWQVPINHATGSFTLNYSVEKNYYDSNFITTGMEIWSKANITLYSPLDETFDRGVSITYYANVTDYYNSSVLANYNCSWWLDGNYLGSSLTNVSGICNFTWSTGCANPARDFAGLHTINSTIGSNASLFYDPEVNNSYTTTTLLGFLRISIDSPANNSVWHKTNTLWLNSTVKDECLQAVDSPTVNWTLNNTEYLGTNVNTTWTIPADHTRGKFFVNATVNKTYYHSAFNISYIEIWGWSNVSWISPPSGTYDHTQVLTLVCKVSDANSSANIPSYEVKFYKNEDFFGSNSTVSDGTTSLQWDTTPEQLGSYVWKCNITDNSTQYYNVSIKESTATLTLQDVLKPSFADSYISPTELEAYYENVTLRINVTDDISVDKVWANISLPNGGNDVVLMTLIAGNSQNGRYEANYTPAISQGGRHNVTIYANDTSGNLNSSYIGYFIAYNQTIGYLENQPASVALRTSQYEGASFILNLTLYNTGNATMRDTKISILSDSLPTGWTATNLTSYEHLTVPKASNYTARWNISIAVAQKPGVYNITGEGKWVNPDYTTPAVTNNTTVTIQENPILNISQNDFYAEQNHSTEQTIGSFYVNSTGNYELSELFFNKTIGNLSQDWVEFWTSTYINYLPSLSAGESKLIYINVTIPAGQPAGIYTSQFVVNATNSIQYCQPEENCWKFLNITVNVTQDWSWKRAPEEFSSTLYTSTSGFLTNVTVTNEGNVNITFAIAKSGNASSLLIIPDSITVPFGSSANLTVNYSVPANQQPGYYEANVSITNSSAQPVQLNVTFKLTVADTIPPLVENASLSKTLLEANYESLNISADASDNIAISKVWANISLPTGGYTIKEMSNIGGNTYRVTYTPTIGGTYSVTVYANDTSGNVNSTFAGSFNVTGTATGYELQDPQSVTATGITIANNYTFDVTVVLKNTGSANFATNGTMRFVNLTVSFSEAGVYSNSTFEQCGNLSVGQNCTKAFKINATWEALITTIYMNVTATWQNPDSSKTNATNRTSITIVSNPVLLLDKDEIVDTISHGTWKNVNYTIISYGNNYLSQIQNYGAGGNLNSNWLKINPSNIVSLAKKANSTVVINVSIPLGQDPGEYITNITSNATGSSCNPASNCWDYLLLNVTVPWDKSWSINPTLQNLTIPTNTTGNFTITVTNLGNVNVTYALTKLAISDPYAYGMTICPESVFVPKAGSGNVVNVVCDYNSANVPGGNYTLYLRFQNSTYASPEYYDAVVGMYVTDLPPNIDNPSVSPSTVDQNYESVTISASISDNIEIDMVWINITRPDGTTELRTIDLPAGTKTYSLSQTYTPTQAGIYYVRIYANDTQTPTGAINYTQLFSFTSIATTSLSMVLNTTQATIEGITQDQGASLPVNVTLNNTGQGGAYWVNLTASLPSGWSTSPTKVDYQNITEGTWKSNLITINIPAGTSPGLYTATLIAKWTNPNNSLGQVSQQISINVTSNPRLDIVEQSLSVNVPPGQNASTNFTLNSTGNDNVTNIQIACIGQQCTDFNVNIVPPSLASLQPLATQLVLINLSVPSGYQPGSYQLMFNASGNNTWDKINLTVNVAQDWRWNRTPESFSASAGVESLGLIGIIEVTNFGNIPILFNVTKEGNASDFLLLNTTQLLVNSLSKGYIEVKYNTTNSDGSFYANISITNSSAQPVQMNTTVYLTVIKLRIDLISPNQSYPVEVKGGDTIQIRANATYEGIITENMTWKVYVGQAECPVTSYSFVTNSWLINCTAPSLPDGRSYALAVYGNYTNYNAVASDSEPNAVYYTDVTPPSFSNVSANSVKQSGTVLIQADIPDNVATTQAKAEVTFPSGFKVNFTMTNTSLVHYQYEFTNTQELGDYDFKIYAQDEKGNTNTTEGWFEVYTEIIFNGTTRDQLSNAVKTNFQFYRNNKPKISYYLIHNFSSNETTGIFNQTLHNRSYDAVITFFKDMLDFAGLETRSDIQQNILIGNLTAQAVNIPNAKTKLRGIALNMSFNFTNVTITLDYSDYIGSVNVEDNIRIFKCANWDFTSWNCNSSWAVLPTTLDKIAHRASTTTTSLSAYFVGEYQEVVPTTTTLPAGGGGGGGGGVGPNITLPVCGNGICETGENWQNCPQDCPIVQKPIQFSTEAIEVTLAPGEYRTVSLGITNNLDKKVTANLSVEGRVWEFVQFEKTSLEIEKGATEYVLIKFFTLSSTPLGNYVGEIVVRADNATSKIPVTLKVEAKPSPLLDITMDVLTPKLRAGETLTLRVTVFTFGEVGTVDVTINYTVEKAEVMEKILTSTDTVAVDRRLEYTKSIKLPSDLEEGRYLVEAFAYYSNKTATAVVSFEVFKEPPIVVILRNLFTDWRTYVVIAVIAVGIIAVRKYIAWKIAQVTRKKYVFPVDFRKLPKGVKVGKIAETNIDAYWDLDKLTQHMIIAGGTGSGKTVAAMVLAEEALKKEIPVIVFDPTAQWTGFVRPSRDEHMLSLYPKFGLRREDAMAFKGNIVDVVDPSMKIEIEKYLNKGEITVFCLTKLTPSQLDDFVSRTIDAIFSVPWEESRKLRLLIVYDEVHRLLPKYGGRKGYLALERGVREFRKWGIGLVMISQVLSDFKGAIRAVIASECQMRTKYSGDIDRVKKSYGSEYAATLPKLNIGTGMVQNPEYNEGRPWFIEFRPLLHDTSRIPERELALYRKYQEEIAEIEKAIESMKKRGIDTYDIELELKLAKEKVKQAQFRMAETYIESLKARIKRGR